MKSTSFFDVLTLKKLFKTNKLTKYFKSRVVSRYYARSFNSINLEIGFYSKISKSKLGNNSEIGRRCVISHSTVEDSVIIGDDVSISNSTIDCHSDVWNNVLLSNAVIRKYCRIYLGVSFVESTLNDCSYVAYNSAVYRSQIGKFCSIGPNVKAGLGKHPTSKFVSSHPIFYSKKGQIPIVFSDQEYYEEYKNITIGNDVWIGSDVIILDGAKIGDGAIIGAGSVVGGEIPPYAIAIGVPATIIRYRFTKKVIKFLLDYQWWNKDIEWLKKNYKDFHDVSQFYSFHKNKNL